MERSELVFAVTRIVFVMRGPPAVKNGGYKEIEGEKERSYALRLLTD